MRSTLTYLGGVMTVLCMITLRDHSEIVTLVACVASIVILLTGFNLGRTIVYLFLFFSALTVEIAVVQAGIWTYAHTDIYDVPFWIPFVWVVGGFVFIQFSQDIQALTKKSA